MKSINKFNMTVLSYSANEYFVRAAVSAFLTQLDPTIEELNDVKTAVSEAVTNCIVHAYKDSIGKIYITAELFDNNSIRIKIRDKGCGIENVEQAMQPLFTTVGGERAGLGFAVMQSFTDNVRVRSSLSKGTVVTLTKQFLPLIFKQLSSKVDFKTDKEASLILGTELAQKEDFCTEFLDYIMGVQVADSLQNAIDIISRNSTHHSDAIITENKEAAEKFVLCIDSAAVYVNASTRFTDGGEFGLGCEMGISTQKLHARGPMGLSELNTYKYVIHGNGQIR